MNPFNCKQVSIQVAVGDLEKAPFLRRLTIRFHLVYCWFCRKYERQLGVIARAFEQGARQSRDPQAVDAIKRRLRGQLHP